MKHFKHINEIIGIALVITLVLVLIHDIQLPVIDAHGKEKSAPVSTESQTSDHSDGCEESCQCIIHALEDSLSFSQFERVNLIANSSIPITMLLVPESLILKSIYRPPEV